MTTVVSEVEAEVGGVEVEDPIDAAALEVNGCNCNPYKIASMNTVKKTETLPPVRE